MDVLSNVIEADFRHEFYQTLFQVVKFRGIKIAQRSLADAGLHPSFQKAALRRILRHWGW